MGEFKRMATHDLFHLKQALVLARRGYGQTSPNPMVGAVLVKGGRVLGRGWHKHAGGPHAEVEAIKDAIARGRKLNGATLYVTLEPCCTTGRTPPCTQAILNAGIKRVVAAVQDPNPLHSGRGFALLQKAGLSVLCASHLCTDSPKPSSLDRVVRDCEVLNESFNHWIVHRTPFVTVKAAMSLDGKIATSDGHSKWITGTEAREWGMHLRAGHDAIIVGVNTILADDPSLTLRAKSGVAVERTSPLRRIILDSRARIPTAARVLNDSQAHATTVVVGRGASPRKVAALARKVTVLRVPVGKRGVNLSSLLRCLGKEGVVNVLVEGGGEVNASFLLGGLAQRVAFFYAPKILAGRDAIKAVAGIGAATRNQVLRLHDLHWKKLGSDLFLSARVVNPLKSPLDRSLSAR